MKKIILLTLILSIAKASFSQDEKQQYIRKGLLRAMGTISPGILLSENASTYSLQGNLEYYVADNISLRGDVFYHTEGKGKDNSAVFEPYASLFSGASYHIKTNNHFDPYIGIQPGLGRVRNTRNFGRPDFIDSLYPVRPKFFYAPLASSYIGFNYYFENIFHLFGEMRYLNGKDFSDAYHTYSLSELRFSFGLGFNINTLKKK